MIEMALFVGRNKIEEIPKMVGKEIMLAGWVHDTRLLGKINFIVLRDSTGKAQITAVKDKAPKDVLEVISHLRQEDVVAVTGKVVESKQSRSGYEVLPEKIEIVNKAETPLPLDPRNVTPANLDTQLDWRVLSMRTDESRAIFKIQDQILKSFRGWLIEHGYWEIQPPIIIASASEGGADLFKLKYFDKDACLAQSPQLYKQMGAVSLEKVFTVLPVFRAEKHDTPAHLNEIRQMDVEQAFADDEDIIKVLETVFVHILTEVKRNCAPELEILGRKDLKVPTIPIRRVTYTEAIEILQKAGEPIKWGDDFTKPQEKKMAELLGEVAFVLKDWPTEAKPFYSMPDGKDPKVCHAFDLMYNGIEICSGTQRIHIPELLIKQLKSKDLDPDSFKFYIDFFRFGAPPHSGWSIGLERLTMQITGRPNIREVTMFPRDRNRITP
jgi:nondiscriminating aspartyl-tRNA synthetase